MLMWVPVLLVVSSVMTDTQPSSVCFVCEENPAEGTHRVLRQRYESSETVDNPVSLCKECCDKIEKLYGESFSYQPETSDFVEVPLTGGENTVCIPCDISGEFDLGHFAIETCSRCGGVGPFKQATHQPSGYPASICVQCDPTDSQSSTLSDYYTVHVLVPEDAVDESGNPVDVPGLTD